MLLSKSTNYYCVAVIGEYVREKDVEGLPSLSEGLLIEKHGTNHKASLHC